MPFLVASLNVLLIGFLAWLLGRHTARGHMDVFWTGLIARLCAGIALGVVYTYYYTNTVGDTIAFFNDAVSLAEVARLDPLVFLDSVWSGVPPIEFVNPEPRSFFFTVMLTFVNLATGDSYWVSSLWFSFFSFCCTWYFLSCISKCEPSLRKAANIAFLFLPTVVFWSSGIIKESVAFGTLCFLAGVFVVLINNRRLAWYEFAATILALWLLIGLKYYWAAVFLSSTVTTLVVHWFIEKRVRPGGAIAAWIIVFVLLCGLASLTHPNFYLERILGVIRENHDIFVRNSVDGNLIHFPKPVTDWFNVMINVPLALFSGLFRPLPFEPDSWTGGLAAVENVLLLALTLSRLTRPGPIDREQRLATLSVIAYVSLLCIFLALSTPNLGTLSRYRIGFLPFFALLILNNNPVLAKWRSFLKFARSNSQ
jgi:hypothetical protein